MNKHNMTVKTCIYMLFLFCVLSVRTADVCANASENVEEVIAEKVHIVRQDDSIYPGTKSIVQKYGSRIIPYALNLIQDPNEPVKRFGYGLLRSVGRELSSLQERKIIANVLVKGLEDSAVSDFNARYLMRDYVKNDFSEDTKQDIKRQFSQVLSEQRRDHYAKHIIEVVGVADIRSEFDSLKTLVDKVKGPLMPFSKSGHKMAFHASKARARMGVKEDIDRCIAIVDAIVNAKDYKNNPPLGLLLEHLEYIRQPEVVEYIRQ